MSVQKGYIPLDKTVFFACDLQEKFRPAIAHFAAIVENAEKLVSVSRTLKVPLIVTEQYPKGLGNTVQELDVKHAVGVFAKTKFSMVVPEVEEALKTACSGGGVECAVVFGIETHVCVEQTCMDLIAFGVKAVHIVADATSSRSQEDRLLAFSRLRQLGCFISTSESVIFKLLKDKEHPKFNELRPLFKNVSKETGLSSV